MRLRREHVSFWLARTALYIGKVARRPILLEAVSLRREKEVSVLARRDDDSL